MLNTVMRLFHSLVSLTLASGIAVKANPLREKVLHNPAELFLGDKVPPGLWSYVRIVNK